MNKINHQNTMPPLFPLNTGAKVSHPLDKFHLVFVYCKNYVVHDSTQRMTNQQEA